MTALASSRRRRPFFGDLRFVIGVALIVASVAGVWLLVASARQTVPVWAVARTLVPGEPISAADLRVVEVSLGQAGGAYLPADEVAPEVVASRVVAAGELLPADAVADAADIRVTRVVVPTATEVPTSLAEGSRVEVWHAPPATESGPAEPRILVPDATVAEILVDDGVIAGSGSALDLVIDRADVSAVLSALTGDGVLSIVPVAGGAG